MRHLIVGLGNPGPKYEATRHNVGFMALDRLADRHGIPLTQTKFHGRYATGLVGSASVALLQPQTYMNLSGKAVVAASGFFRTEPSDIVVVHDEVDLELGTVKVKIGGGHGGHNGLRDIIAKTGSKDFVRIRVGIGRPQKGDVTNHVLGPFRKNEVDELDQVLDVAADAIEVVLDRGPEAAQNEFNGR
jgi:PTH1 family peptidyl-tRNA hydrolase